MSSTPEGTRKKKTQKNDVKFSKRENIDDFDKDDLSELWGKLARTRDNMR